MIDEGVFFDSILYQHLRKMNKSFVIHRNDGYERKSDTNKYFHIDFEKKINNIILEVSKGQILDVGACVGRFSLELQSRGKHVIAIDQSATAVFIMKERGVKNVYRKNIFNLSHGKFDTIIFPMCNIGFIGKISRLPEILTLLKGRLKSNGILLIESINVEITKDPVHIKYHNSNLIEKQSIGYQKLRFQNNNQHDEYFDWLHISSQELMECCSMIGLEVSILHSSSNGHYLATIYNNSHSNLLS